MTEQKPKKIKSHSLHKSPQRRVSFSKPWTPTNWPDVRARHGSKDSRIKKHDASSSTTVDTRRRSQSDPTPTHLKYGMFRRFSKLQKQSDTIDISPPSSPKRRSSEIKPILVARSSISRPESAASKVTELPTIKRSIFSPSSARLPPLPPPRPQTKHVNLSRTNPIHLDIKPKRFPSMLWC